MANTINTEAVAPTFGLSVIPTFLDCIRVLNSNDMSDSSELGLTLLALDKGIVLSRTLGNMLV